jgi:hypothetical protein
LENGLRQNEDHNYEKRANQRTKKDKNMKKVAIILQENTGRLDALNQLNLSPATRTATQSGGMTYRVRADSPQR